MLEETPDSPRQHRLSAKISVCLVSGLEKGSWKTPKGRLQTLGGPLEKQALHYLFFSLLLVSVARARYNASTLARTIS